MKIFKKNECIVISKNENDEFELDQEQINEYEKLQLKENILDIILYSLLVILIVLLIYDNKNNIQLIELNDSIKFIFRIFIFFGILIGLKYYILPYLDINDEYDKYILLNHISFLLYFITLIILINILQGNLLKWFFIISHVLYGICMMYLDVKISRYIKSEIYNHGFDDEYIKENIIEPDSIIYKVNIDFVKVFNKTGLVKLDNDSYIIDLVSFSIKKSRMIKYNDMYILVKEIKK